MTTMKVTDKGQVTLRKDLLKHLGVQPGDRLEVDRLPDGRIEVRAARPGGRIDDVFGMLHRADMPSLSLADIERIAGEDWAGKR